MNDGGFIPLRLCVLTVSDSRTAASQSPEVSSAAALADAGHALHERAIVRDDVYAMREFLGRHPAGYPIAIIDTFAPPADFETPRGLPMTWLIAPDGKVAERFLGPVTAADIERVIAAYGSRAA